MRNQVFCTPPPSHTSPEVTGEFKESIFTGKFRVAREHRARSSARATEAAGPLLQPSGKRSPQECEDADMFLFFYLRAENADGNVLIAVYLYACVLFA